MATTLSRQILRAGAIALTLSSVGTVSMFVSADAAYAERGGNGNSNRGNSASANRGENGNSGSDRGSSGNNDRGSTASELKGLNAAHANQRARDNASASSMVGRTATYQRNESALAGLRIEQETVTAEYERLTNLSDEEIAAEFADGGYDDAVAKAYDDYLRVEQEVITAGGGEDNNLSILTAGRELTEGAINELNRLLGLDG